MLNEGCLPENELHNEETSKYRQRADKHTSTHKKVVFHLTHWDFKVKPKVICVSPLYNIF